jgi:hypothetical protein
MARILFKPEVMDRVRRERHWGMVEEKAEGDGVAVTLLDFSLEWLAARVLSFGTMADILAPERLAATPRRRSGESGRQIRAGSSAHSIALRDGWQQRHRKASAEGCQLVKSLLT